MTQEQLIVLLLKIVLISGVASIIAFVVQYTILAPWWRNPIGRTLVTKDVLLIALFTPSILSVFIHFNRLTSIIAAWVTVALLGLVTPVMIWRMAVWYRMHKEGAAGDGS